MKKSAFTMLELVFVIVAIGILSAVFIPKFGQNKLSEAANQLVSHIRYTQHLALMEDMFDPNDALWYKKRWQIVFSTGDAHANNQPSYSIFSDTNKDGTVNKSELAINPLDKGKYMTGGLITNATLNITDMSTFVGTKELNLGTKYGVRSITLSTSCSTGTKIAFDHLGRPLKGPLAGYTSAYQNGKLITTPCDINITRRSASVIIRIEPETGYVHIL
ncbi:type II secretion system GspH family protein [bacterium]|nr:type II secretion system GspH family protein [bacterium]MBU1884614.1 type II secretion system GspH family protein [bacterium]